MRKNRDTLASDIIYHHRRILPGVFIRCIGKAIIRFKLFLPARIDLTIHPEDDVQIFLDLHIHIPFQRTDHDPGTRLCEIRHLHIPNRHFHLGIMPVHGNIFFLLSRIDDLTFAVILTQPLIQHLSDIVCSIRDPLFPDQILLDKAAGFDQMTAAATHIVRDIFRQFAGLRVLGTAAHGKFHTVFQ